MRILIAGCGYVGCSLARLLVQDGHRVWGLRRGAVSLPDGVELVRADLTRRDSLRALPGHLDAIVYLPSPAAFDEAAYRRIYCDGLEQVLAEMTERDESPRVVLVTSTSVYGQTDGSWVDEESPTEPTSFAGRILLEAEGRLMRSRLDRVILRFGGIYGPGRTRLIDSVRSGSAVIGPDPVYTNRIHRDDCAGVIRHLLGCRTLQSLFVAVDSHPAERGEVLRWMAEALGVASPDRVEDAPIRQRGGNKRCRNARLLSTGYQLIYPGYRDGYAALIAASAP